MQGRSAEPIATADAKGEGGSPADSVNRADGNREPSGPTGHEPDYEFWSRMPGWRVNEQAALILGLDPDCGLKILMSNRDFQRMRLMLNRARTMGQLRSPAEPRSFLDWAKSNKISLPPALVKSVERGKPLKDWSKIAQRYKRMAKSEEVVEDETDINPKSKRSILIILLAIAIKKYNYKNGNNHASSSIENDVMQYGARITSQTVRFWLGEAENTVGDELSER